MKYRAKPRSEVIQRVHIVDEFYVQVRYLPRRRWNELDAAHTTRIVNPLTGQSEERRDVPAYRRAFITEVVVGWEGLTPTSLAALVELDAESPQPATNGDGTIPYDLDLCEFLWTECHALQFETRIWRAALQGLEAEAAKKNALIGIFDASS